METPQYTNVVGKKFHEDRSVRTFPGNTVISKITPEMPIYPGLVEAQRQLKAVDTAGKYAFLPPSSFHMTVMEGLCDQARTPERWSTKLALDLPLTHVNQFMVACFAKISLPHAFTMRIVRLGFSQVLVVVLEAANEETADALQQFREHFSTETGIRFPDHETYTYHISLAYNVMVLTSEEEHMFEDARRTIQQALITTYPRVELGRPRLTFFENMFRFDDADM
ncbi:MAG: DUF1868 domain-containing protein [Chloroflexales bacterium]|nr:DUF1868 domain-containing protein [Chloroflexales bacterium]